MKKFLMLTSLALLLTACGEEKLPITVSKMNVANGYQGQRAELIQIVAKDTVTIKRVTLNRGNCDNALLISRLFPRSLKFGEVFKIPATCDDVLEAAIETDKGTSTFTWK